MKRYGSIFTKEPKEVQWRMLLVEKNGGELQGLFNKFWPAIDKLRQENKIFVDYKDFQTVKDVVNDSDVDFLFLDLGDRDSPYGLEILFELYRENKNTDLFIAGMAKYEDRSLFREAYLRGCQLCCTKSQKGVLSIKHALRQKIAPTPLLKQDKIKYPSLNSMMGIGLNDVGENIIKSLFPLSRKLELIEELKGGHDLEGSDFLMHPRKFLIETDDKKVYFVKIGLTDKLSDEEMNYRKFIEGRIDNFSGRVLQSIKYEKYHSIKYSAIPSEAKGQISLKEFLREENIKEIVRRMQLLFRILYDLAGTEQEPKIDQPLSPQQLWEILPPLLHVKFEGFIDEEKPDLEGYVPLEGENENPDLRKDLETLENYKTGKIILRDFEIKEVKFKPNNNRNGIQLSHQSLKYKVDISPFEPELLLSPKLRPGKHVTIKGVVEETLISYLEKAIAEVFEKENIWVKQQFLVFEGEKDYEEKEYYEKKEGFQEKEGFRYPNPLKYLYDFLHGTANKEEASILENCLVTTSVVHGDLNLNNVRLYTSNYDSKEESIEDKARDVSELIPPPLISIPPKEGAFFSVTPAIVGSQEIGIVDQSKEYSIWLIDFEKTQKNFPTLFDYVKLEVELKNHIVSDCIEAEWQMVLFEESLPKEKVTIDNPITPFEGDLYKYMEIIRNIRQRAFHYCQPISYFIYQMVYALSALKFDMDVYKKRFSFIQSCVACKEVLNQLKQI